jgi:hypothetical protein
MPVAEEVMVVVLETEVEPRIWNCGEACLFISSF